MNNPGEMLPAPGMPANLCDLRSTRGRKFAEYLQRSGRDAFVTLKEVRRQTEPPADIVVFDIEPERPQILVHDIRGTESVAVQFLDSDAIAPDLLALRPDFPNVPHVNQRPTEFPRSLCMYDTPWADEKLAWTPVNFLQRVQTWFSKTADGTLHAPDQPLEQFIAEPNWMLVVPPEFDRDIRSVPTRQLEIFGKAEHAGRATFFSRWPEPGGIHPAEWICASFECTPQTHGVIRRTPTNLSELHEICLSGGIELLDSLRDRISTWLAVPPFNGYLNAKLIIILILPKTRTAGGEIEHIETRGFLTVKTVREIGADLGIIDSKSDVAKGAAGLVLFPAKPDPSKFSGFPVMPMGIHRFLSPDTAAIMNGAEPIEGAILAVGAGAFGSQVLNNLTRAGMAPQTIVDNDLLMPHNCARHLLTAHWIGTGKAEAVAANLSQSISLKAEPIKGIAADILSPGQHETELRDSMEKAELIFDFSASVTVGRHLGRQDGTARRISAFITPNGSGMVMLLEDAARHIRLDWLEALHYRAILNTPSLDKSFRRNDRTIRTGASCREISVFLAQADMATWAGIFSGEIVNLVEDDSAVVKIFQRKEDGEIEVITFIPGAVVAFEFGEWTILIDDWLLKRLGEFREERLPNETGGVLLGVIDTEAQRCAIVDALPSPPDSIEWPNSYIRGCCDLLPKVKAVEEAAAGQVTYVGEWHSHPRGHSTRPSNLDFQAHAILKEQRDAECLPTLMLIVGDALAATLVPDELLHE